MTGIWLRDFHDVPIWTSCKFFPSVPDGKARGGRPTPPSPLVPASKIRHKEERRNGLNCTFVSSKPLRATRMGKKKKPPSRYSQREKKKRVLGPLFPAKPFLLDCCFACMLKRRDGTHSLPIPVGFSSRYDSPTDFVSHPFPPNSTLKQQSLFLVDAGSAVHTVIWFNGGALTFFLPLFSQGKRRKKKMGEFPPFGKRKG